MFDRWERFCFDFVHIGFDRSLNAVFALHKVFHEFGSFTGENAEHGIVPRGVVKQVRELIDGVYDLSGTESRPAAPGAAPGHGLGGVDDALLERTAEKLQGIDTRNEAQVSREIRRLEKQMATYARNLDFEKAAQVRDELAALKQLLFGSGGQPS